MSKIERQNPTLTPLPAESRAGRAAADTTEAAPPLPDLSALGLAGDDDAVSAQRGPRATIGLPEPAGGAVAPVPAYAQQFGGAGYVKDGADASLLGLARRAAAQSPALAAGTFGESLKAGRLAPEDVKTLQRHLAEKGYDVGKTGPDGKYGPRTHEALAAFLNGEPPATPADGTTPASTDAQPGQAGAVQGQGMEKDGLRIPAGEGRATTFWNGHIAYKGKYDMENRQNNGIGAWGDKCAPTDYFVALPVSDRRWHNKKILVTNPATGQQVVARVQDKGPAARTGAKIDLSPVAMEAIGGHFRGDLKNVRFEFAPDDAPVGPVR